MAKLRVPVVADLEVEAFSAGTFTQLASYMENAVVGKYSMGSEERYYITQRPGISLYEDASATVSDTNGRGIYYWETTGGIYFVNADTVYKGSYASTVGTVTTALSKVEFAEVGSYLAFVDAQNNEGWTITTGDVLAQITDAQFPTALGHGCVNLNGYMFVIDTDGTVWNSDLDDPTSWNGLNFINAEREPDGGVAIAKHHDHIVAFGSRTIEFFYDAGNPVGSPLSRRQDIYYNIGCVDGNAFWQQGDRIYFIGASPQGHMGVYELSNFQIKKVSNDTLDSYITNISTNDGISFYGAGFSARGHDFFILTPYIATPDVDPVNNLVYDSTMGLWYRWTSDLTQISSLGAVSLASWTIGSNTRRFGQGILTNGDLITITDNLGYQDSVGNQYYIENQNDYVVADYVEVYSGSGGVNITMKSRFSHQDEGTNNKKFIKRLEYIGDNTSASQDLLVRWSDTDHSTFNADRTIDTSSRYKLSRLGATNRRTWEIEYGGSESIRIEALEMDVTGGSV